ncbi:MAG: hypothetical protein V4633_17930 [Pseudomonadota bacterium]
MMLVEGWVATTRIRTIYDHEVTSWKFSCFLFRQKKIPRQHAPSRARIISGGAIMHAAHDAIVTAD